jgi:zinc protease
MMTTPTPDRTRQPRLNRVQAPDLPEPIKRQLSNGLKYYIFDSKQQDAVRIDIVFRAGTVFQKKPLVASTTARLLKEGNKRMTGQKLSARLDYYGAYLDATTTKDHAWVSLLSLRKNVRHLLPMMASTILEPTFGQNEFERVNTKNKQEFIVNSLKPRQITNRIFGELVFGPDTPYGQTATEKDYDNLQREELIEFHQNYFQSNKPLIILSGNINHALENQLIDLFSAQWVDDRTIETPSQPQLQHSKGIHWVDKAGSLQSAFKMGLLTINRSHSDFPALLMLNTVLGGYFGSRLMSNIREDKGYTYGINSQLAPFSQTCLLSISSEVGREVTTASLNEVRIEIDKLRTSLIPEHELNLVRNYLSGSYLRSLEGPFNLADKFRSLIDTASGIDYYSRLLDSFQRIDSDDLRNIALKYLDPEQMLTVITGEKID